MNSVRSRPFNVQLITSSFYSAYTGPDGSGRSLAGWDNLSDIFCENLENAQRFRNVPK